MQSRQHGGGGGDGDVVQEEMILDVGNHNHLLNNQETILFLLFPLSLLFPSSPSLLPLYFPPTLCCALFSRWYSDFFGFKTSFPTH